MYDARVSFMPYAERVRSASREETHTTVTTSTLTSHPCFVKVSGVTHSQIRKRHVCGCLEHNVAAHILIGIEFGHCGKLLDFTVD